MTRTNLTVVQFDKQETPEELLLILQEDYKESNAIFWRYARVLFIALLMCAGASIYYTISKGLGLYDYAVQFTHGYILFAVLYFILRYKMKPKKPTLQDAMNWRERRVAGGYRNGNARNIAAA